MNSQDVQTVNGKLDAVLVTLAAVVALGGVLGFSLLSEQSLLARLGILAGGLVAGLVIAWFSLPGKRFIGFSRESYDETRRVVWPSIPWYKYQPAYYATKPLLDAKECEQSLGLLH